MVQSRRVGTSQEIPSRAAIHAPPTPPESYVMWMDLITRQTRDPRAIPFDQGTKPERDKRPARVKPPKIEKAVPVPTKLQSTPPLPLEPKPTKPELPEPTPTSVTPPEEPLPNVPLEPPALPLTENPVVQSPPPVEPPVSPTSAPDQIELLREELRQMSVEHTKDRELLRQLLEQNSTLLSAMIELSRMNQETFLDAIKNINQGDTYSFQGPVQGSVIGQTITNTMGNIGAGATVEVGVNKDNKANQVQGNVTVTGDHNFVIGEGGPTAPDEAAPAQVTAPDEEAPVEATAPDEPEPTQQVTPEPIRVPPVAEQLEIPAPPAEIAGTSHVEPERMTPPTIMPEQIVALQPPEPEALETNFNVVIAGDKRHIVDEERKGVTYQMSLGQNLDGQILIEQNKKAKFWLTMPWRSVKNIAAGFYQRTLLQPLFEEREGRWRRGVMEKTGLVDLPNELVETALKEGKKRERVKGHKVLSWLVRNSLDRFFYNPVANLFGLSTTNHRAAQEWAIEEVGKAKRGENTVAITTRDGHPVTVKDILIQGASTKENFAQRMALGVRAKGTLYKEEDLNEITDNAVKTTLVTDMFRLLTPYITGTMNEEQALRIVEQYCDGGATVGGDTLRLKDRLEGDQYAEIRKKLTTVGVNMRNITEVLKKSRDGVNLYQQQGIVENAANVEDWIHAWREKKLQFSFFAGDGEMTPGARRENAAEKAIAFLNERNIANILPTPVRNSANFVGRVLGSFGLNEITAAHLWGYGGHFFESFIPTNGTKVALAAGVFGIPAIPVLIATTIVGLPVAIPIAVGSAVAAGVFAGVREVMRLQREYKAVEWEASIGKVNSDIKIKPGALHRLFRGVYGATDRTELLKNIAHQRKAGEIINGLAVESGLFENPTQLNIPLTPKRIQNLTQEQVAKSLRWYSEYKARSASEIDKNRRFFDFGDQALEGRQRQVMAGAAQEVIERLAVVFAQRADLKNHFFQGGTANLGELVNKLQEVYQYNLLGGWRGPSQEVRTIANILGVDDATKGFITKSENLGSRNTAEGRLIIGKGLHRIFGTVVSALTLGDIWAEAQHNIAGTPPSMIIGGMLKEYQNVVSPGVGPGNEFVFQNIHFKPPIGSTFNAHTGILQVPGKSSLDLNVIAGADNKLDYAELQSALRKIGLINTGANVHQIADGFDSRDYYTEPLHDNNFKLPNGYEFIIKTPGEVDLDPNKDGVLNTITIGTDTFDLQQELKLSHPVNLYDKDDVIALNSFLKAHHLSELVSAKGEIIGYTAGEVKTEEIWNSLKVKTVQVERIDAYYYNDWEVSERNELLLETYKNGDAVGFFLGKMKHNLSERVDLEPPAVSVEDVIGVHKAGIFFMKPGDPHDGLFLLANGTDKDGNEWLWLDPNDTRQAILVDSSGTQILATFPDGTAMTYGDFYNMLINKDALEAAQTLQGEDMTLDDGTVIQNIATEKLKQQSILSGPGWAVAGQIVEKDGKSVLDAFAKIDTGSSLPEKINHGGSNIYKYTTELTSQTYKMQKFTTAEVYNFELPGETKTGEFTIGVIPAAYTDYTQIGKAPERSPDVRQEPYSSQIRRVSPPQPRTQRPATLPERGPNLVVTPEVKAQLERKKAALEAQLPGATPEEATLIQDQLGVISQLLNTPPRPASATPPQQTSPQTYQTPPAALQSQISVTPSSAPTSATNVVPTSVSANLNVPPASTPDEANARTIISPEEKANQVKQEIFEKAGKRNVQEITELLQDVQSISETERRAGKGKLKAKIGDIQEKGVFHDRGIAYIPKGNGKIISVGDIHGDAAAIEQIINKEGFIENMEAGDRSFTIVFMGDVPDRGKQQEKALEIILELKKRYPLNVMYMKADHELGYTNELSGHDFVIKVQDHYGFDEGSKIVNQYDQLFNRLPRIVVSGSGLLITHGGIPVDYQNMDLLKLADNEDAFDQMMWADPELPNILPTGVKGNSSRVKGDTKDALQRGLIFYSVEAAQVFLRNIGASAMLRAHQVTADLPDGKPDPFAVNATDPHILYTIHSTGFGSTDTGYSIKREPNPTYAVFDKDQDITSINSAVNIKKVWL